MIELAPIPLHAWAQTDAQWWNELASAKTAWMQGRDAGGAAAANMDAYLAARAGKGATG